MTFSKLALHPQVLAGLKQAGFDQPTPVQSRAIPTILAGKDLLANAQTGTGKTAAFLLPILSGLAQRPHPGKAPRVLVLSPTRELASQIGQALSELKGKVAVRWHVIYGGVGYGQQINALRSGLDVVIATPGRLQDHLDKGTLRLDQVETLVLDEADQLLDMGFLKPIQKIVRQTPKNRQTLLFSATMPQAIVRLAQELMTEPERLSMASENTTTAQVDQHVLFVDRNQKKELVMHLLEEGGVSQALIFTRTKAGADRLAKHIDKSGIRTQAIHGNKSQNARDKALLAFRNGKVDVLVATDVAARGIDIEQLPFVVNYDLPNQPETYIHRIGRTGRAGLQGVAYSFCDREERAYLRDIQNHLKTQLSVFAEHPYAAEAENEPEPPAAERRKGKQQYSKAKGQWQKSGKRRHGGQGHNNQGSQGHNNQGGQQAKASRGERNSGQAQPAAQKAGGRGPSRRGKVRPSSR